MKTEMHFCISIFYNLLMYYSIRCSGITRTVIIRQRGHSKHYAMGNVLSQLVVTSALDCAQSCASRDDCQGSMLRGNLCVLYKKARCLCLLETTVSLGQDLSSRYQLAHSADALGIQDAMKMCKAQNMELLAINNELEQDKVTQFIKTPSCKFSFTIEP